MDKTNIYNFQELRQELIKFDLEEIIKSIKLVGQDPNKQLLGYLVTNDPIYITKHNNSRKIIKRYEKNEILLCLINHFSDRL